MAGSFEEEPTQVAPINGLSRPAEQEPSAPPGTPTMEGAEPVAAEQVREARPSGSPLVGSAISFLVAFVVVVGLASLWLAVSDDRQSVDDQATAEMAEAMAEIVADFEEANDAVAILEQEVAEQERQVAQLERQLDKQVAAELEQSAESEARRRALQRRLASARQALAASREALEGKVALLEGAVSRAQSVELEKEVVPL